MNLGTAYNVTRAAVPGMIDRGWGRVVMVSSVTGPLVTAEGSVGYSAAKAGMDGLMRGIAIEVADRGVTVNSVAPGWIATGSQTPAEATAGRLHARRAIRHAGRGGRGGGVPRVRPRQLPHRPGRSWSTAATRSRRRRAPDRRQVVAATAHPDRRGPGARRGRGVRETRLLAAGPPPRTPRCQRQDPRGPRAGPPAADRTPRRAPGGSARLPPGHRHRDVRHRGRGDPVRTDARRPERQPHPYPAGAERRRTTRDRRSRLGAVRDGYAARRGGVSAERHRDRDGRALPAGRVGRGRPHLPDGEPGRPHPTRGDRRRGCAPDVRAAGRAGPRPAERAPAARSPAGAHRRTTPRTMRSSGSRSRRSRSSG